MIAKVQAATLVGIEAAPIVVELDQRGAAEAHFVMVGLPD